jgi:hypothetical protein
MRSVSYGHTSMAIKMVSIYIYYGTFFIVVLFAVPCWPPGQYGAKVVSSGFYQSPAPMLLGNVLGVGPAHLQGHQNGKQWRLN